MHDPPPPVLTCMLSSRQDGPGQPGRGLYRGHDAQVQAPPVRTQRHQKQTEGNNALHVMIGSNITLERKF